MSQPVPTPPELAPGLEDWLRAGAGGPTPCERMIETSISWVFLYADRVLKLKKPVDFGFVDFTTGERRRWAAERELLFNRATAPDIYRAVHAIVRDEAGGFTLDGEGQAVDWALEMRRFDEKAVLSEQPEVVRGDFAEALGRRIAQFHIGAPRGFKGGGAAGIEDVISSNARQLEELAEGIDAAEAGRVLAASERAAHAAAALLDDRLLRGLVRRCHGDLHLGNIVLEGGRAVLFDCIEFNDALSEIDVLYDLAFLLMDLGFRGEAEGANRSLNGWCDEAARVFGDDAWRGLAALGLFQAIRATVRAHVCGHGGDFGQARSYLAAAARHLSPARPVLTAVGGFSASGKSTFARAVSPMIGPLPGAVVLRSDEVRKRLWGKAPTDRLPPDAYTPEASAAVYEAMFHAARACMAAGWPVVLDAAFLDVGERSRARALAEEVGTPFEGIWLDAPAGLLKRRIAKRAGDASDADLRVLEGQLARDPGPIDWRRLDAADLEQAARVTAERLAGT